MSEDNDSELFTLLQPELLTAAQLISYLNSRCSNMQNLSSMSKERLVRLFRQVVLPLPQRQCWANRRGKALTARRLKSGPEGGQDTSSLSGNATAVKRPPSSGDRLKPAPDTNTPNKIRITSSDSSRGSDLDRIVINDRRKLSDGHGPESESSSPTRIHLKRSSSNADKQEKCSSSSAEPTKKQKTAIKWP